MRDFATLAQCKKRLKVTGTDDDDELKGIMQSASYALVAHVRREPRLDDYDETFDGNGLHAMVLRQYPLVDVSAVYVNGYQAAATAISFNKLTLYRTDIPFARGIANVRVVYSAGFDPTPRDLVEGYYAILKAFWMNRDENPSTVSSQIIGVTEDQWSPEGPGAIPLNAQALLRRFFNPVEIA